jgi:copper chaperone CopZ
MAASEAKKSFAHQLAEIWFHGLEIVQSIWIWLLIGILVSAAIDTVMPDAWLEAIGNWGLLPAMFLVLMISVPLYVCATASVPIAAALVYGGIPPAAALVFLMAGPATNVTTIGAVYSRFGWRTLFVYLATIIVGSMLFAWFFDWLLTANVVKDVAHHHDHQAWWSIASAIIMLAMMVYFAWEEVARRLRRPLESTVEFPVITIPVEGMTCSSCVGRLEKALSECDEIESVQVQLNPGLATIIGKIQPTKIHAIVRELGFVSQPEESAAIHTDNRSAQSGIEERAR